MKKLNIVYISRSIIPSRTANSLNVIKMCSTFASLGHKVTLLAPITKKLEEKGIKFKSITLAYQSKVGPMKWLEPSLDDALKNFADEKVVIYPIAFIVDNSETDFELNIEYREMADEIGISEFKVCKCVNDSDSFIEAIKDIIKDK